VAYLDDGLGHQGMETNENQLLEEFYRTGSDRPFEALVERHAGLVYHAALRRTRCETQAEDTTQIVFAILMRKAGKLVDHPCLAAWLHKTATLEASRIMRTERNHERKLRRLEAEEIDSDSADHPVGEHLDEAMTSLSTGEQQFLLWRYYQGYHLREIAGKLGKSEAATRKHGTHSC